MTEEKVDKEKKKLKSFIAKDEHEREINILHEELKRKDELVETLRKDSKYSLGTAIKQADRNQEIIGRMDKAIKENTLLKKELEELKKELEELKKRQ